MPTKDSITRRKELKTRLQGKSTDTIPSERHGELIMPRGKYRGKYIHDIPSGYLLYIAENWAESDLESELLVGACDLEYQYRERYNCHWEEDS